MPAHSSGESIAIEKIRAQTDAWLEVSSDAFADGEAIPARHSEYGDGPVQGVSPPLSWSPHPDAQAYALIVQDPDAPKPEPVVHWVAWNIPAKTMTLPEGLAKQGRLDDPPGVIQGRNVSGAAGYYGMKPPDGDGLHRYHFQVFALSETINLGPDTPFDTLLNALKSRVLAEGEVTGTFERRTQ